jgi:hypothetical protein
MDTGPTERLKSGAELRSDVDSPRRAEIFALPVSRGNQMFEDEDDDDTKDAGDDLPDQSLVRLNVIHVAYDVVVLHLDCVNLLRVTLDDTFTANISDNP